MNNRLTICLFAVFFACAAIRAQDIKLDVSVNRSQIYLGESVTLQVKVSGVDPSPAEPDVSGLKNCRTALLGSQSDSRYNIIVFVNGQFTRSGHTGRTFTYEVTPIAQGEFVAGPVKLTVHGKTYAASGPRIQVSGIELQERVLVKVAASRESVLVDEPFDVTLSVAIKKLPPPHASIDPMNPSDPPALIVPYLTSQVMEGLEYVEYGDTKRLLQTRLLQNQKQAGFIVNDYTIQSDFDFEDFFNLNEIMRSKPAKFMFDRRIVTTNGIEYMEYSLRIRYLPKEERIYTFGPVTFKGAPIESIDVRSNISGRPVFAVGAAATVRVVPPPEAGRPVSFIGAIGTNVFAEAALDTQNCKVGDALKLTLSVKGNIRLDNIYPPPISAQSNLVASFKVYDDTLQVVKKDDRREFVWTIRPMKAGSIELPSIEVSYYDAGERMYKTIMTKPLPVRAEKTDEVIFIDTVTNRGTVAASETDKWKDYVAPMHIDPAGSATDNLGLDSMSLFLVCIGPVVFAFVTTIRRAAAFRTKNRLVSRRMKAVGAACAMLKNAERLAAGSPNQARTLLCTALKKYISGRFDTAEEGLTPADMREILMNNGIPASQADELYAIAEKNFNAGFTGSKAAAGDPATDCTRAIPLLVEIDKQLMKRSTARDVSALKVLAIALLFSLTGPMRGHTEEASEKQLMQDMSDSILINASTKEAFSKAGEGYTRLINSGVYNGGVFYNQGVALLLAERYEEALRAFSRAERYTGTSPDILNNMLATYRGMKSQDVDPLPWHRIPLFWHFGLGLSTRMTLAAAAFMFIWVGLFLRMTRFKGLAGNVIALALVAFVLFGSSAVTSFAQEQHDRKVDFMLAAKNHLMPGEK